MSNETATRSEDSSADLKEILEILKSLKNDPWITNAISKIIRDAIVRGEVSTGNQTIKQGATGDGLTFTHLLDTDN